jgi:hypothetical protein
VLNNGMCHSGKDFELIVEETGALILILENGVFTKGFIPQSINIGIEGDCSRVGALIADETTIILVTELGTGRRVGYSTQPRWFDNLVGHLAGGFEAWEKAGKETDAVHRIT